jgi:hypothetical protein
MSIPFPGPGFIPNPPYPIAAWVPPSGLYSPVWAWRQTPPPANTFFRDQTSNQNHVATISSNNGKALVIATESGSKTFDITGDGTANLPLGVLISP